MIIRRNYRCTKLQAWYRMKKNNNKFKKIRKAAWIFTSWLKTIIIRRKYLIKIKQKRENENLSFQLEQLKQRLKDEEENRIKMENETRERMRKELQEAAEKDLEQLRNQLKASAEEKLKAQELPPAPVIVPAPVSIPVSETVPITVKIPDNGVKVENCEANQETEVDLPPKIIHSRSSFVSNDLNLIEQLQREILELRSKNDAINEENLSLKDKNTKLSSFADLKMGEVASAKVAMTKAEKDHEQRKSEHAKMVSLISKLKKEKQILMQDFLVKSSENDDCIRVQSDLQRR